jgi:hypothetical protein
MNTTVVPEVKVPSRDEQLVWLREKLAGNKTFGVLRGGGFHRGIGSVLHKPSDKGKGYVGEHRSPSEFCTAWDEFSGQARVMGNLLACLERDGWKDAYQELKSALCDNHIIEGETVLLENTTPVTLLLFSAEKTFDLLHWGLSQNLRDLKELASNSTNSDEYTKVVQGFPTFAKYIGKEDDALGQAFSDTVMSGARKRMCEIFGPDRDWDDDQLFLRLRSGQVDYRLIQSGRLFGYMFPGKDQKDLLCQFPRAEQEQIATWTINMPTVYIEKLRRTPKNSFWVGFHPESGHDSYKSAPFFPSTGVNHGMGAVIITDSCQLYEHAQKDRVGRYPLSHRHDQARDGKWRVVFDPTNCFDDGCTR